MIGIELLFPEVSHADHFALDQLDLFCFCFLLGAITADFFLELLDALSQLLLLANAGAAPQVEQPALAFDGSHGIRVIDAGQQIGREGDARSPVAFAFEARLSRRQLVEPFCDDGKIGARNRIVEAHDYVTGLDSIAVTRAQFTDDASSRMLDFLHVGIDDHRAGRNERTGQLHRACPSTNSTAEYGDNHQARQGVAADGTARL